MPRLLEYEGELQKQLPPDSFTDLRRFAQNLQRGSWRGWYYHGYTWIIVKTAVSIPDPVFQAAERLGIPCSQLYSRAIERYVSETQERDVTMLLNQVYAAEQDDLDAGLAALQWASIPHEDW